MTNTTKKSITFAVTMTYESLENAPICEKSARDNLHAAIENERVNGALTPYDISAQDLSVTVTDHIDGKLIDFNEALGLLIDTFLCQNDGVTIEDFINEATDMNASYLEGGMLSINSTIMDIRDIREKLKRELGELSGESLIKLFKEWVSDINIQYQGDSLFVFFESN